MPEELSVEQIQLYVDLALPVLTNILIGVLILIFGSWASGKAQAMTKAAASKKLDPAVGGFLGSIAKWGVMAAAVIAALGRVGVETTSFIAILGSAGLAIGLALQGSLASFAAGVMVLIFKPFTAGHVITAAGHTGEVTEVGLFATTLLTPDRKKIIIPNSAVTGGSIVNHSAMGVRVVVVPVGIAYGSDLNKMREVTTAAAREVEAVLDDQPIDIVFMNMAASAIEFDFKYRCNAEDVIPSEPEVREAVYKALLAADIEIPFDQVVMHQAEA